jgi:type IV pilus assembly protein PilC
MMDYRYVAYTSDRTVVKGTQAAANPEIAAKLLTNRGYRILSLRVTSPFLPRLEKLLPSLNKVPVDTVILFTRQLALLLECGTDLVTSLEQLRRQANNRRFKQVLGDVISDIRTGQRLSHALSKHPEVFPKMYVQSLIVGEQGGIVEPVIRQVAEYMEKDVVGARKVKDAMRYPAIVMVVAVLVVGVLTVFVLPAFTGLYQQLGVELPPVTRMVFGAVAWFSKYGMVMLLSVVILSLAIYGYGKTAEGKLFVDRIMLKLPLIGRVIHLNEMMRCCRSMSVLHKSGMPIAEMMLLVIESSSNSVMKQSLTNVYRDVLKGQGLSVPMAKNDMFLPLMVQMVAVGEATGNLESTLTATAAVYETEADKRMHSVIEMIQPTITVVLGVVVALVASALVSAMYSLYGQMG